MTHRGIIPCLPRHDHNTNIPILMINSENIEVTKGKCENVRQFTSPTMEDGMQSRYIMTAFGKDRPGIVADVTRILYENGCNLEDTTMSMLDDEFTINLLFSAGSDSMAATLADECRKLEQQKNISAFIRPVKERRQAAPAAASICTIHVEGLDQAGIVYKVSQFLSDQALNIVDLKSTVKTTPESGTALYLMDIHIQLPASIPTASIEEGLNTVAEELNVEISVIA